MKRDRETFWVSPLATREAEEAFDLKQREMPSPELVVVNAQRRWIQLGQIVVAGVGLIGAFPVGFVLAHAIVPLSPVIGTLAGVVAGLSLFVGGPALASGVGNGLRYRVAKRALADPEAPELLSVGGASSVALPSGRSTREV